MIGNETAPGGEPGRAEDLELELLQLTDKRWSREEVSRLIAAFGREKGADGLALDENGLVWLTIDDASEVCLIHLPHLAGLVAAAPLPPESLDDEQVLRALLQANMSWQHTQGGIFAIAPPADEPMICQLIPLAAMDPGLLEEGLAAFVALAQGWSDQIEQYLDQAAEGPAAALAAGPPSPHSLV